MSLDTPVQHRTTTAPAAPAATRRPRRRRTSQSWATHAVRAALIVVWLGSWEITARTVIDPFYYSMPSQIWDKLVIWFTDGTSQGSIWANIAVTLEEAVLGFALGTLAGVVLGVVLGRSRFVADVLAPFIKGANAIPRIVLASLFVIWFGLGMSSKVATAFVLVFFAVFFNAFQGAREVDKVLVDNARILGASRWDLMRSVILPSATSWILASMHVAFGFALIGAIVGEYTGADQGLGLLINHSQGNFDAAGIYAGMLITTVLALVAEWLITQLEVRLTSWRPPASGQASGL
ncbi:ABC transporter permease [Nocardioides sp. LS1]|uniref:ABC transporter permease n=1 Tax=Nocardioides sp. LS1 TaxID=1027620 RepID=UPI000FFAF50B|nr:ABC transporter permease [Nocardioides sp. LS1]GCD88388.1 ABC transporter permease [Nocardioides sp. LS1]